MYLSPSFEIFVVQPVSHVMTAAEPSSFQVPVIPSAVRLALAEPSPASVISKAFPPVSATFQVPSNWLAPAPSPPQNCGRKFTDCVHETISPVRGVVTAFGSPETPFVRLDRVTRRGHGGLQGFAELLHFSLICLRFSSDRAATHRR